MKNITQFYLEFIKVLIILVFIFTIFGYINDSILSLLLPNGVSINDLAANQGLYRILYLSQIIGCLLIFFILYKNFFQFYSFYKTKKEKQKFTKKTSIILSVISFILILNLYIALI